MKASKTMNLLMVAYNYESQNKKILVIKPSIDTRFGEKYVCSRTGIKRVADIILKKGDKILFNITDNIDCVLVDEVQFLTREQIDELRIMTLYTPVICYGLRTDYTSNLFEGSKRLMAIADSIEEIKTICSCCPNKSVINAKYLKHKIIKTGDLKPDLGCEEKYLPMCWNCWHTKETVT